MNKPTTHGPEGFEVILLMVLAYFIAFFIVMGIGWVITNADKIDKGVTEFLKKIWL